MAHRHALALLQLAEELDVAWDTAADLAWAEVTRSELDNLRAAVDWALAGRGEILAGQRLAALAPIWEPFAPLERRRWITLARAAVDESTPSSVLAELSFADCLISHHLNEFAFELPTDATRWTDTQPSATNLAWCVRRITWGVRWWPCAVFPRRSRSCVTPSPMRGG